MGFFDELNSNPIKSMPDGQQLFFPFGNWGRSYVISTHRLQRLLWTYTIAALALGLGAAAVSELWLLLVAAFLLAFYYLWVPSLIGELGRSDEAITYAEVMAPHARLHDSVMLWVVLSISLLLAGFGIGMAAMNEQQWMFAVPTIAFFGLCSAGALSIIVLRNRKAQNL